jgi:hypothetical protein
MDGAANNNDGSLKPAKQRLDVYSRNHLKTPRATLFAASESVANDALGRESRFFCIKNVC